MNKVRLVVNWLFVLILFITLGSIIFPYTFIKELINELKDFKEQSEVCRSALKEGDMWFWERI